jgi:hypothetical protein
MRYVGPRHIVIDGDPVIPDVWKPDRSFEGLTVVLIGGGPSHADIDLGVLKGHRFIAINSGCRKVRPVATEGDILYFTDNAWNENRPELAADWPGLLVTTNRNAAIRAICEGKPLRYVDVLALTAAIGALPDHVQASSGHIAACLAALMGASRIVLTGFECQVVNGRTHGHGDYSQHDLAAFDERFLPGWRVLARAFQRMGVDVVNATPQSAVTEFRFESFAQALGQPA